MHNQDICCVSNLQSECLFAKKVYDAQLKFYMLSICDVAHATFSLSEKKCMCITVFIVMQHKEHLSNILIHIGCGYIMVGGDLWILIIKLCHFI